MRIGTTFAALTGLTGLALGIGVAVPPLTAQTVRTAVERAGPLPAPGAGWLGIRSTMTVQFDVGGGTSTATRLRIDDVYQGGPAWQAGLRSGDLVIEFNGQPLRMDRFQSLASRLLPGDPVSLTVLRDGRPLQVALEAAPRPGVEVLAPRQIQETLDSTRRVFVTRLDSVADRLATVGSGARVELRRIEADSIETVEVRAEAGGRRVAIRTSDGVFEWMADPPPGDSLAPRSFSTWVFRTRGDTLHARHPIRGDSIRVVTGGLPDLPTPPPAPSIAIAVGPSDEVTAPVRPLAPYLAGMNRVAGAEFTPLVGDLATYFQADHGLLVTDVAESTPAAAAGLVPGDVIVAARSRPVASIDQLRAALSLRDGPITLSV
ncbi:MAG: PDZ domain-containing protein, partial [Longimicrobiales bacterium]